MSKQAVDPGVGVMAPVDAVWREAGFAEVAEHRCGVGEPQTVVQRVNPMRDRRRGVRSRTSMTSPTQRLTSAAGARVAVAGARGQSLPAPAVPAVSGGEDLARLRHANNLLRVARMHGDAHHRRLRLDPVIEALPGLADVITAEDPAVAPPEGRAH